MRNLLTRVPNSAQSFVATMVRTIFAQPDTNTIHEQHRRIVDQLETRFTEAAALLDEAAPDLLASRFRRSTGGSCGATTRSNAPTRRSAAAPTSSASSPDRADVIRLVGAVLAEQNDKWAVASRRYPSVESLARALAEPAEEPEEVMAIAAAA